jgi:hypothetical protein
MAATAMTADASTQPPRSGHRLVRGVAWEAVTGTCAPHRRRSTSRTHVYEERFCTVATMGKEDSGGTPGRQMVEFFHVAAVTVGGMAVKLPVFKELANFKRGPGIMETLWNL